MLLHLASSLVTVVGEASSEAVRLKFKFLHLHPVTCKCYI